MKLIQEWKLELKSVIIFFSGESQAQHFHDTRSSIYVLQTKVHNTIFIYNASNYAVMWSNADITNGQWALFQNETRFFRKT